MRYKVGQYVKQVTGSIRPYGKVVEIMDIPERGIFQLKLESGWCVHPIECQYGPGGDEVEIIEDKTA